MRLLFIRHGEPDYEKDSLTEKGFREAEYLAEYLAGEKIDTCYVSPLGRAKDTAAPTLKKKTYAGRRMSLAAGVSRKSDTAGQGIQHQLLGFSATGLDECQRIL